MTESRLARVRSVRDRIRVVAGELMHPRMGVWERCRPEIEGAAELLRTVEQEMREAPAAADLDLRADLREEVMGCKRELRQVSALATAAAEHHQGWAHLLGLALGGYSPKGAVVELQPASQLMVKG